ncbi:MAG: restriction endonuclease subunit S [Planctomycetota bacterium]|nr:restriction endonuclease subunit S [Planctomycetota bacterium]
MTNLIDFVEEGVPFIKSESVAHGRIDFDNIAYITEKVHRLLVKSFVNRGDILFTKIGAIGRVAVYDGRLGICNSNAATAKIQIDPKQADPTFIAFQLGSERVMREFEKTIISTPPRINLGDINAMMIECPPLPEQHKIAKILTTVDNLIEKTEALIAKYQSVKQGLMYDLFTRGVDQHGHLRPPYAEAPHLYKESALGWIPREWHCTGFGDFIAAGPQNGLYKPNSAYSDEGTRIVRIDGFYDGVLGDQGLLRRLAVSATERRLYGLEPQDILINRVNCIDYVGKSAIVTALLEPTVFESNIMRIELQRERLLPEFAIRLLCSPSVQLQFHSRAKSAVAQASINQVDVRDCVISVPAIEEQWQIVGRCQSVDRRIHSEQKYLTKLRTTKTALMQDLLTGEVRVKVDESVSRQSSHHAPP